LRQPLFTNNKAKQTNLNHLTIKIEKNMLVEIILESYYLIILGYEYVYEEICRGDFTKLTKAIREGSLYPSFPTII